MISLFLLYQQKNRKNILLCKLSADILWIAHYYCIGAVAGIIPNLTGVLRELVFINRKAKKWANSPLWVVFFILLNFILGIILSFKNWFDIIPIAASSLVTIALWLDNPNLTKTLSAPVSASFLIYDIFVSSHMGVINESISLISIMIYFLKHKEEK